MSVESTKPEINSSLRNETDDGASDESAKTSPVPEVPTTRCELPPFICLNTRRLIKPKQMAATNLLPRRKQKKMKVDLGKLWCSNEPPPKPIPKYPIQLSWWPDPVCFQIGDKSVTQRIWISNRSCRSINMHVCGMWNGDRSSNSARLGASWHCYPHTTEVLAPGLISEIFLRATPREVSPISTALIGIQVATAHKFDQVFGFFVIPVYVTFNNVAKAEEQSSNEIEENKNI